MKKLILTSVAILFFVNYLPAQWITNSTINSTYLTAGKVGIGTVNPISDFQLGNYNTKLSLGNASSPDLNWGTSYIGFNAARSAGTWTIHGDNLHNGGAVIYGDIIGNIYFVPIANNGATAQTLTDLQIKSKIAFSVSALGVARAKQIIVETANWPDYVFKNNYKLPTLLYVENYINQNKRLPEMPSEEQVVIEGIDLAASNKLLVKKIEELTLYMIDLNKKVINQQNEIEKLKKSKHP